MLALGALRTALAYVMYFNLLGNVGSARAVTVTFLIPVFGILWGAVFLHERVTYGLLGGCAVVLVGTGLATGLVRIGSPKAG
jgi:drug/metabolite transporter (DMT)-like permease